MKLSFYPVRKIFTAAQSVKNLLSIKQLAIAVVNVGRLQLGFLDAPVCLFEETCTRYSRRQLQEQALALAVLKIIWRVMRCNPITGIMRRLRKN